MSFLTTICNAHLIFLQATVALHKVSDASGKLVFEKIVEKPLKQSMLKTEVNNRHSPKLY